MTDGEIRQLSDERLLAETQRVATAERRSTADLIALLMEVERRGVHLSLGYSSLFMYCTKEIRLSEQGAYSRITAARVARRLPLVLEQLVEGTLTLSSLGLLAPHLTAENHESLLEAARCKTTREVERMIACLHPQPDISASGRAVPVRRQSAEAGAEAPSLVTGPPVGQPLPSPPLPPPPSAPPPRAVLAPLSERRYWLKVTISQETHDKLQRARALLRHVIPDGDPAAILDRALTLLVDEAARVKYASTTKSHVAFDWRPRLTLGIQPRRTSRAAGGKPKSKTPPPGRTPNRAAHSTPDRASGRAPDRVLDDAPGRAPDGAAEHTPSRARPHDRARPEGTSRYIPAEIKRTVWARDGGRCAFVGAAGRCRETGFLEFHHVVPFAAGGPADAANLQLRCRAHNAHEARVFFGADRAQGPPADV